MHKGGIAGQSVIAKSPYERTVTCRIFEYPQPNTIDSDAKVEFLKGIICRFSNSQSKTETRRFVEDNRASFASPNELEPQFRGAWNEGLRCREQSGLAACFDIVA